MTTVIQSSVRIEAESPSGGLGHVVWLRGEHDRQTVPELEAVLDEIIGLSVADVVVDLSEVGFLGVAPLRALFNAEHRLARASRSLRLRAPLRCAQRTIELCRSVRPVRRTVNHDCWWTAGR